MERLEDTVRNIYCSDVLYANGLRYYSQRYNGDIRAGRKYLEIPLSGDILEIPTFAVKDFGNLLQERPMEQPFPDALAIKLYDNGYNPSFKSIGPIMKEVLHADFQNFRLIQLKIGEEVLPYYAAQGVVFDSDFVPIFMCSWQLKKKIVEDAIRKYEYIKPILRIAPRCILWKEDSVIKHLINKLLPAALANNINCPSNFNGCVGNDYRLNRHINKQPRVIIEECPFTVKTISAPSISTTNEMLSQAVVEHIDDMRL